MKKIHIGFLILFVILSSGCGKKNNIDYLKRIEMRENYVDIPQGNLINEGYLCESEGVIYFRDINHDGFLCKSDYDGSNKKILVEITPREIQVQGDKVYFLNGNLGDDNYGRIMSISRDGGTADYVGMDTASYFIVTGSWIFYLSEMGINKSSLDGTEHKLIKKMEHDSEFAWLNIYGEYLFYVDFLNGQKLYAIKEDGTEELLIDEGVMFPTVNMDELWYRNAQGTMTSLSFKTGKKIIHTQKNVMRSVSYLGNVVFYNDECIFLYNRETEEIKTIYVSKAKDLHGLEFVWSAKDLLFFTDYLDNDYSKKVLQYYDYESDTVRIMQ